MTAPNDSSPWHDNSDATHSALGANRTASRGVVRILRTHWWLIVLAAALAMAVTFVYLRAATRVYTSTAMIHVEQNTPSVVLDGVDRGARFDNYLYTQAELIRTTPILGEVLKRRSPGEFKTLRGVSDPVAALQGLIECTVGKKNDIVSITLSSPYPEEAAQLLNQVVQAYLDYHSKNTRDTASEILRILKEARQTGTVELSQVMQKTLDFRRTHGVLFLDNEKGNLITQRLAALSDELTRAELARIQAQVSHESVAAVRQDPARVRELFRALEPNASSSSQERTTLAEILSAAEVRHAGLLQKHAAAHPAVLEAAAECEAAREQLRRHDAQQLDAILAVVEQRYRAAEKKEAELRTALNKQRDLAMDFNAKAVEYAMLESDLKRKERLCDILEGRIKEIDIRGDAGGLNIAVLEWAKVAAAPSRPQKTRIAALGLMIGLVLGLAAALTCDWLDDRIREPGDLDVVSELRVLGEVPFSGQQTSRWFGRKQNGCRPPPILAEDFSGIRAILCPAGEREGGTILLTSPGEAEGKTTTVRGLAMAIAHSGASVLLVDADFLSPRQHEWLGLRQSPGLSELLSGQATVAETISSTVVPGFHLLASGAAPAAIPRAIGNGACARLLELLTLAYDYVLVDSPPALATADIRVLAASCDRTILVLKANRSTTTAAARARQLLCQAGAAVIGAVLTGRQIRR